MMELSHSLLLNEDALSELPDNKKSLFIFEWLLFVNRVLPVAQKSDIKGCQQRLVEQLNNQIACCTSPSTRKLLAQCLAVLFTVGDTYSLFQTINFCNDLIRNKDDSPSFLPARLNAICCLGAMYEKLGRMVGRSFEETTQLLVKSLKNAESQGRVAIMRTFEKMTRGLGTATGPVVRKDVYKSAKTLLNDRSMGVRCAAAVCLEELNRQTQFIWSQELENVASSCFKAFESSNYDVRKAVSRLLGTMLALGHNTKLYSKTGSPSGALVTSESSHAINAIAKKSLTLEDCWSILASGFLRGALGFYRNGAGAAGSVSMEIRVGVSMAYVDFFTILGPVWLERNSFVILSHLLDLAASPAKSGSSGASTSDCLFIRACIGFIIRRTFGSLLKDQAQIAVCRELGQLVAEHMNSIDLNMDSSLSRSLTYDHTAGQQIIVVALLEMSHLIRNVGGAISPIFLDASGIVEPVFQVLLHPCLPCRMACAWCLRCIAISLPSLLTPFIDRCLNRLEHQKTSFDAICGYTLSLSSLLCSVPDSTLGIPQNKWKQISAVAEELLRTAPQTSRLTLVKTQGAWLIYSALMSFGPAIVKNLLPKLLLLWKNSFPRSAKEAEAEPRRGDNFTWHVTLEARIGALTTMQNFLLYCKELASEEILRRCVSLLELTLVTLRSLPQICKQAGVGLKNPSLSLRLRLYKTLQQISPRCFESLYSLLLRELIFDFTLTESTSSTSCTVYRNGTFHHENLSLKNQYTNAEQAYIEFPILLENSSCIPAIENDTYELCRTDLKTPPASLPLQVALIDTSIGLFGTIFPFLANKHRLQMLDHFNKCLQIKNAKQQIIHTNIAAALLLSLKAVADSKLILDNENVVKTLLNFFEGPLNSPNLNLRSCAAEGLGRLALAVEPRFFNVRVQFCVEKLTSCRDEISRTGNSLALGCLHQCVGGLSTQQNLNITVGILLALAQDTSSTVVQIWSTYALSLVASSSGPIFRSYVDSVLSLCTKNLLNASNSDLYYCTAKLFGALILAIGPELHSNSSSVVSTRTGLQTVAAILSQHDHPVVRAEAICCLQQMHLFAPRHVNISTLVPLLCTSMKSSHFVLRKSSLACLRQLVQREAKEVYEHSLSLMPQGLIDKKVSILPDSGLEGALFCLMDNEVDVALLADVKETLTSLLQHTVNEQLSQWLNLCKEILVASSCDASNSSSHDVKFVRDGVASIADALQSPTSGLGVDDDQREDETMRVGAAGDDDDVARTSASSVWRDIWPTTTSTSHRRASRTFAVELVRKILTLCRHDPTHFDLALAKQLQVSDGRADYLVLHLSDLIRMSFMASTSNDIDLRLIGLACLQDVIVNFSDVPEPEFPGHVILEQFQAQVGAALRPAFTPETPSHATAAACQVCSTWIGSGVARDLNDLRRVHQLLTFSLEKLKVGSNAAQLYNESAATLEKLSILKAWAEVYIVSIKQDNKVLHQDSNSDAPPQNAESLLSLVTPELPLLVSGWLQALQQWALLTLPLEYTPQVENFIAGGVNPSSWSIEPTTQSYYRGAWPQILLATATWLKINEFQLSGIIGEKNQMQAKKDRFLLLLGEIIGALCSPKLAEKTETIDLCLESLETLLKCQWAQIQLTENSELLVETLNVLCRIILTNDNLATQILCSNVFEAILDCCATSMTISQNIAVEDLGVRFVGREGLDSGKLIPGKSVVYAALEVCLCRLSRQMPHINQLTQNGRSAAATDKQCSKVTSSDGQGLIVGVLKSLIRLPSFCSDQGLLTILPTMLHMIIGTLCETSKFSFRAQNGQCTTLPSVTTSLFCLRFVVGRPIFHIPKENEIGNNKKIDERWIKIVQSALITVINLADSSALLADGDMDKAAIMLATSVFLVASPHEVVCAPNLIAKCLDVFKMCFLTDLNDRDTTNQITKTLQSLQSIFAMKDKSISTPFIRHFTPLIIEQLKKGLQCKDLEIDVTILIEAEKALEIVVAAAGNEKRFPLVSMVAQLLCSFLPLPHIDGANELHSKVSINSQFSDFALQRLNKFGPLYPLEFRCLLQNLPGFKERLENAVRYKQENSSTNEFKLQNQKNIQKLAPKAVQQPAITLAMNFDNYS